MVTIVYAYRNREVSRIKSTLDSLLIQTNKNFKVVFVDYGSDIELSSQIKKVVESYSFATYYYIHAQLVLWNKSKTLNYGIKKTTTPYVFIADVDLIFSPDAIALFQKIAQPETAFLFNLGYLSKKTSNRLLNSQQFNEFKPKHFGNINGMLLVHKEALEKVNGYDTFFHFYGSEDVDLYQRLSNAGYEIIQRKEQFFYHNWHIIYNTYNDGKMSVIPRLYNVKRINQQHYLRNKDKKVIIPDRQLNYGEVVSKEDQEVLLKPTETIELKNIHEQVHHFFKEELQTKKETVLRVLIKEDPFCRTFKYWVKKLLKKQSQPYISMKAVNDLILMKIIYIYRDVNYTYEITKDLKTIIFTIKL
ncbi:glycosyltransferase family 2 protein [Lutibacter sp. B1]|uniref:glycosyltransferase family 2 protein n=1 Tax=Lutibacter sp. B1 TaxID=2725996 RepID=UPI0014576FC3|nr:glycosyltransferase [Lutibacter sp. B1]NLP58161.1 glycosyltransferase [Lutibacter sp. B1]